MFVSPGTLPDFTHRITREAAERVASNWWRLLLNGALLIVAGVLIFSIDWSVRSLATFIGALFILEGLTMSLTTGIEARVTRTNVVSGLLCARPCRPWRNAGRTGHGRRDLGRRGRGLPHRHLI
jgi:hypothetical protein